MLMRNAKLCNESGVMIMKGLAQKRKSLRMTQKDLAQKFNVSLVTVCRWEKGKQEPSYETLKRLAVFFGCSVDELLATE